MVIMNEEFLDQVGNYAVRIIKRIDEAFSNKKIYVQWARGKHATARLNVYVEGFGTFLIGSKDIKVIIP